MNRIFIFIIMILYSVFLFAKNDYKFIPTKHINNKVFDIYISDSIKVIDTIYSERKSNFYTNECAYIIHYNALNNLLYLYQIDTLYRLNKVISLYKTDANQTDGITDVYLHNLDSIFVITQDSLYIINKDGDRLLNAEINNFSSKHNKFSYGNIYNNYNLYYYKNKVYFFAQSNKGPQNFSYYKKPIDATYSLLNRKIQLNKIFQSKLLQKNIYGLVRNACKISHDSLGIITFYNDPNIYVYNYNTGKSDTLGGKSSHQLKEIVSLEKKYINDKDVQYKHFMLSPWYVSISWDPYRHVYYRFFINGINEKSDDGLFNTFKDKHVILMVFNERFDLLAEKDIGLYKDFGVGYLTITPVNVYLQKISDHKIFEPDMLLKLNFHER